MTTTNQTDRRLAELVEEPRETLDVEVKEWLDLSKREHQAALAKEIIALANHGGGFVVVGFKENKDGNFVPSQDVPENLQAWSQDNVQGIVARYLDPPIQCRVDHCLDAKSERVYPVISVPGGHRIPIVAKKGSPDEQSVLPHRVYVRRPGPNSEEPRSIEEWHQLFDRIVKNRQSDLFGVFRMLMAGEMPTTSLETTPSVSDQLDTFVNESTERWMSLVQETPADNPTRMPHGYYDLAFALDGEFDKKSLKDLQETIQRSVRNHSGWPPFLTLQRPPFYPRPIDGAVEVWIGPENERTFDDSAHSDFWRISPEGLMFTRRGFSEDGEHSRETIGSSFDITTAAWRLGEGILNASYIAAAMGGNEADLVCRAKWTGLSGRQLVSHANPRRLISDRYRATQDTYETEKRVAIASVDAVLPELVFEMLSPLYELFDFFQLPSRLVEQELAELQRNTFAI